MTLPYLIDLQERTYDVLRTVAQLCQRIDSLAFTSVCQDDDGLFVNAYVFVNGEDFVRRETVAEGFATQFDAEYWAEAYEQAVWAIKPYRGIQ